MSELKTPIHIIGLKIRITNANGQSFKEIPPLWEKFMAEQVPAKIEHKLNDNIYVLYTNFDNEGVNNEGMYDTVIGCAVKDDAPEQEGFFKSTVPASQYLDFSVPGNNPMKVGEVWQQIWAMPQSDKRDWSFRCEYECYQPNGQIDIYIGLK